MRLSLRRGASSLSLWERVAAKRTGEGLGRRSLCAGQAPRLSPPTPVLRTNPLPLGEGVRVPSPMGRGWPRSGRARGCGAGRSRGAKPPRLFPLNPVLRTNPLPMGEGCRALPASIEAWRRRSRLPRSRNVRHAEDFLQHPVEPFLHLVIGEAEFEITVGLDRRASLRVGERLFGVMLPVEFDRQAEVVAAEIDDIAGDRRLPAKLQPVETRCAKFSPQECFGRGAFLAEASGDLNVFAGHPRWPAGSGFDMKAHSHENANPSPRSFGPTLSLWERVCAQGDSHG